MFTHYKLVVIRICQKLNQTVNKRAYWDISVDQFQSFNCVLLSNRNASNVNFNNKDVCYKH